MVVSTLAYAGMLGLMSLAAAQTTYTANTNTNCATSSDVTYQATYYYPGDDTMDWGVYTQSTGTCDAGSYARVHMLDPSGNDIDCGYVALDGKLNLVSCANYPRGYMTEGSYTLYWETVPGANQYSWNQFTVTHSQSTTTVATPTQSVTTTPITVITSTVTSTPTESKYIAQSTVTTYSATQVNTVKVTQPVATITTTTTSLYTIPLKYYAFTTTTAYTTAPCYREDITQDYMGKRGDGTTKPKSKKVTRGALSELIRRLNVLRIRDDNPNTVGIIGKPVTSTVTPDPVITTITASTSTSTVTTTTNVATVTVTVQNPTPTVTLYSGVAVQTITTTLPQSTKSVVRTKFGLTIVATTTTLTYTRKVVTTPVCGPTGT